MKYILEPLEYTMHVTDILKSFSGTLNGKANLPHLETALKYVPFEKTKIDLIANWRHDTPPEPHLKVALMLQQEETNPNTFADLEREELGVEPNGKGITAIVNHEFNPN
jgi:hypothetical protein